MYEIVTTTGVFPTDFDSLDILERLAGVGFRGLDISFGYCVGKEHPFVSGSWREWATVLRERAKQLQVRYGQAHSCGDVSNRGVSSLRCFEACEILGIHRMVIHPVFKWEGKTITDDALFVQVNADAVRGLIPYAKAHGVTILIENLLWGSSVNPFVIADVVKAVNSPYVGWCFDTGHANCSGIPMRTLRDVPIIPLSLHIQDTCGQLGHDDHLIPGDGVIDWKEFLDILYEIGYEGDLVLEAHHQSYYAEDSERDAILSELLRRAQKLQAYLTGLQ